jgi:hypothetical protein
MKNIEERQVDSTCLSSIFSISFHYSTYFSSIFFISFHYSTCLSSIFFISFHNFLPYCPKDFENTGENSEKIGKIWKKIVKRIGKYGRKITLS